MSVTELTQALVRIPSENPTGSEEKIGEFVAGWLKSVPGVEVITYEVRPGRPNVIGVLRGETREPGLAYLGHMDTVPRGEGWVHGPFDGTIDGGKLYGRGSTDMKGGLAAILVALKNAAASGRRPRKDFIVCATMDEEGTDMLGAVDLVKQGYVGRETMVVATEPTGLELLTAHKGVIWYEIVTRGKNAHAGNPQHGVDAIHGMAKVLAALKDRVAALPYDHPILGRPSVTYGKIEGGEKTNVVPDRCRVEVDMRLVPPMTIPSSADLLRQVTSEVTAGFPGLRAEFRQINIDRPPVETDPASPVIDGCKSAFAAVTGTKMKVAGFPAYTDAAIISAITGNPHCALFGPGRLEQAHTIDEFVSPAELETAAAVLTEAARRLIF
ncbi:MAG: M20 family metallopeptidase [Bacillota bacterium]